MELKERIKKVRKNADLTQAKFAEKLGVEPSYISLVESGKRDPSELLLKSICQHFWIEERWLIGGFGGNPDSDQAIHQTEPKYAKHGGHKPDFEKSMGVVKGSDEWESIGLLYEIVKDGDPAYRRAIMANLVAFSTAIRERKKSEELKSEVASLKAEQERNTGETEKLRQELNELREIVKSQARAEAYSGPDRRIDAGESPDGIERRRGIQCCGGDNKNHV